MADVLHAVCASGTVAQLESAINQGSRVDQYDTSIHRTPLHYALDRNPIVPEIVLAIINRGGAAVVNQVNNATKQHPLHVAAARADVAIVQALINAGATVTQYDGQNYRTPLHYALERNPIVPEIALAIIARGGADVVDHVNNQTGQHPIHIAAARADVAIVRALINAGANCDLVPTSRVSALHIALQRRPFDKDVILAILGACSIEIVNEVNAQTNWPALHTAVGLGVVAVEVVKALIDAGARLNQRDASGATALMIACNVAQQARATATGAASNPTAVVELLLEAGAEVDPACRAVVDGAVQGQERSSIRFCSTLKRFAALAKTGLRDPIAFLRDQVPAFCAAFTTDMHLAAVRRATSAFEDEIEAHLENVCNLVPHDPAEGDYIDRCAAVHKVLLSAEFAALKQRWVRFINEDISLQTLPFETHVMNPAIQRFVDERRDDIRKLCSDLDDAVTNVRTMLGRDADDDHEVRAAIAAFEQQRLRHRRWCVEVVTPKLLEEKQRLHKLRAAAPADFMKRVNKASADFDRLRVLRHTLDALNDVVGLTPTSGAERIAALAAACEESRLLFDDLQDLESQLSRAKRRGRESAELEAELLEARRNLSANGATARSLLRHAAPLLAHHFPSTKEELDELAPGWASGLLYDPSVTKERYELKNIEVDKTILSECALTHQAVVLRTCGSAAEFAADSQKFQKVASPHVARPLHSFAERTTAGEPVFVTAFEHPERRSIKECVTHEAQKAMAGARVVRLLHQLASGLAVLHAAGLVHGSIDLNSVTWQERGNEPCALILIGHATAAAGSSRGADALKEMRIIRHAPEVATAMSQTLAAGGAMSIPDGLFTPAIDSYALGLAIAELLGCNVNTARQSIRHPVVLGRVAETACTCTWAAVPERVAEIGQAVTELAPHQAELTAIVAALVNTAPQSRLGCAAVAARLEKVFSALVRDGGPHLAPQVSCCVCKRVMRREDTSATHPLCHGCIEAIPALARQVGQETHIKNKGEFMCKICAAPIDRAAACESSARAIAAYAEADELIAQHNQCENVRTNFGETLK